MAKKEYKFKSWDLLRSRVGGSRMKDKDYIRKRATMFEAIQSTCDEYLVETGKWLKIKIEKDLDIAISLIPELEDNYIIVQDEYNSSIFYFSLQAISLFDDVAEFEV